MKPTQDFTAQNLFWLKGRRIPESLRANAPKDTDEWLNLAKATEVEIADGSFRFRGLFASTASGKPALSTSSSADALVLRKINDNIRRAYGIRQTQRSLAVKLARLALSEWTPKGIVALDLKSCFENITPKLVVDKLRQDAKVSSQTIYLLELLFERARRFGANKYTRGLPRGILVSSTLAELYLTSLDEGIKKIPGVYVYIRYVDDILLLASRSSHQLVTEVNKCVAHQDLVVNRAKSRNVDAGCACAFSCDHLVGACPCANKCICTVNNDNREYIDYLGYRLIFATGKDIEKYQRCHAMIAPQKANKIKKRVALAIHSFKRDLDFDLLDNRMRYLTSNVTVDRALAKSTLRSGVAHTYDQYDEPADVGRFKECSLKSLDVFSRTKMQLLFAVRVMTYMQKRKLRRHSFFYGHANKHRASFAPTQINQIKECWLNGSA
jgi:hypothetical protein